MKRESNVLVCLKIQQAFSERLIVSKYLDRCQRGAFFARIPARVVAPERSAVAPRGFAILGPDALQKIAEQVQLPTSPASELP